MVFVLLVNNGVPYYSQLKGLNFADKYLQQN